MQKPNFREFIPIALLSLLLFASCTQLPIMEEASAPVQTASQSENTKVESGPDDPDSSMPETVSDNKDQAVLPSEGMDDESVQAVLEELVVESAEAESEPVLEVRDSLADLAKTELDAALNEQVQEETLFHAGNVDYLCEEIGNKLGSVSVEDCMSQKLQYAGAYSINHRPLTQRDFEARNNSDGRARILIMGGIHGDEYSSISIMFKWMQLMNEVGGNSFNWRFLPTVNPDGLLDGQAERQNASGVDLNRNFPSQDWTDKAQDYWHDNTGQNPRRYPGVTAASEPEVRWIIDQIEQYQPEVIVSVHAPYHLLDFDGPAEAPEKIGDLYLHQLGVYPGSLGNYAGLDLGIPVVTLELPSAGIMPSDEQIETMWIDMLSWLDLHTQTAQNASL